MSVPSAVFPSLGALPSAPLPASPPHLSRMPIPVRVRELQSRSRRHRAVKFCRPERPAAVSHPTDSPLRSEVPSRGQTHHAFMAHGGAEGGPAGPCRITAPSGRGCWCWRGRKGSLPFRQRRGHKPARAQSTAPQGRTDASHGAISPTTSPQRALYTTFPRPKAGKKRTKATTWCFTQPRPHWFSCPSHHILVAAISGHELLLIDNLVYG